MSEQNGRSMNGFAQRKEFATSPIAAKSSTFDAASHVHTPVWKPKSPELRRRKYSLASVMRKLEKKSDDNKESKEELKDRKLQKRDFAQNNKHAKRRIFNLRSRQNNNNNNKAVAEECSVNGVSLIPPVPSELGYNDLRIEEVEKPRSSSIIHASENVLLSDVQRQRSPRSQRGSPSFARTQGRPSSVPASPLPSPSTAGRRNNLSPGRFPRTFRFDSGYDETGEKSPKETPSPHSPRSPFFDLTNADIRTLAYSELGRVLQGKRFHAKHVATWSKKITEEILLKVRRLTNSRKKIIVTAFIGEKFPGTVEVFVSSPLMKEQDNFQTVSIQINDIFAWLSIISTSA